MSEKKSLSARKYLEQLQEIDISINQELERLEEMKSGAGGVGAIDYSKDRVQTSPVNALERRVCNYIQFEKRINGEIEQFSDAKEQIIREIRELHHRNYVQVLFKVYVQYKSFKQVADEMNVSYKYVCKLHHDALRRFSELHSELHYLT